MDFGSIFTSSANGSCNLLAMDVALLCPTSKFGNSSVANLLAEYTDAPASFTMIYCTFSGISFKSSTITISDSLEAVPLPTEIKGNTGHVVTLDEDGQLEKLASTLKTIDGKDYIQFSTTHLSTFAIYALGENGTVQIEGGNASLTTPSARKDYSPNTGDNSIHPKWFIAIGLTAFSLALIAYKPRKKRRK